MPGVIGAFRREALAAAGGLGGQTLAEDTDLTMAVCRPPITMCHECALFSARQDAASRVERAWRRADHPDLYGRRSTRTRLRGRAERRIPEALPVYAAHDQDVCGVDM